MSDVRVVAELPEETVRDVLVLLDAAARIDGQSAVSEQGRLHLRGGPREGVRHLLAHDDAGALVGYGQLEDTDPVEPPVGEFVVHPSRRGRGHGRALGQRLLSLSGKRLRVWAHGGHPAARRLATSLGLSRFRELRQLRRPLTDFHPPEPALPPGVTVRSFVPGQDDAAWLAVNAAAFAHHPEQGALTQRDLDDRKAEPWFDPAGFFLAVRHDTATADLTDADRAAVTPVGDRVVGFHWTKVHREGAHGLGEVYVLGVAPREQGNGLGRALTLVGLRHLAHDRRLPTAMLYVDADNAPAVAVYERLGFTTHETDLMYRTET